METKSETMLFDENLSREEWDSQFDTRNQYINLSTIVDESNTPRRREKMILERVKTDFEEIPPDHLSLFDYCNKVANIFEILETLQYLDNLTADSRYIQDARVILGYRPLYSDIINKLDKERVAFASRNIHHTDRILDMIRSC